MFLIDRCYNESCYNGFININFFFFNYFFIHEVSSWLYQSYDNYSDVYIVRQKAMLIKSYRVISQDSSKSIFQNSRKMHRRNVSDRWLKAAVIWNDKILSDVIFFFFSSNLTFSQLFLSFKIIVFCVNRQMLKIWEKKWKEMESKIRLSIFLLNLNFVYDINVCK